jgi:hypothetical protein
MGAKGNTNLPGRSRELAGDSPRSKDFVFVEGVLPKYGFGRSRGCWSIFVEVRSLGVGCQQKNWKGKVY